MSSQTKAGGTRGVRPKGKTLEIIQEAEQFGVNVNEMLNVILDANQEKMRQIIEQRKAELRKLLRAA